MSKEAIFNETGLVIGGGGSIGIAWEIGIFKALENAGISLKNIPIVIGTSAGSFVGAQYFCGRNIDEMINEQKNPDWLVKVAKFFPLKNAKTLSNINNKTETKLERRTRLCRAGYESRPFIPQWIFLKIIKKIIKVNQWPEKTNFMPTAVDCKSFEIKLWKKSDDIPLLKAVASSGCVPKVAPPIKINGKMYVDGGCGSASNLDQIIGTGAKRVIFIGPFGGEHSPKIGQSMDSLKEEIEQVKMAGIDVLIITPGKKFAEETGDEFLNPAKASIALECGIEDGLNIAEKVKEFLK
jgi:NTE family protein